MKIVRYITITIAIITVLLMSMMPTKVLAVQNPDGVSIDSIRCFNNIFETGDWLIVAQSTINFGGNNPSILPNDLYTLSLLDTTGSVVIQRDMNTYGASLNSIYMTAAQVSDYGLVWDIGYIVRLQSKPPYTLISDGRSLASNYVSASMSANRDSLGEYVKYRMQSISVINGVVYTVDVGDGTVLNTAGATLVLQAIPGCIEALQKIFQSAIYASDVSTETHNETYQETLSRYLNLSTAESLDNWVGTSLALSWDRKQGDYAVEDTIAAPTIGGVYPTGYYPIGQVWDLSQYVSLQLDLKCSRYSDNFTLARLYLYDTGSNSVSWNISFVPNLWTTIRTDNLTGEFAVGAFNSANTANITVIITSGDAIAYTIILDSMRALRSPNIIVTGFKGLADYLKTSPEMLAIFFFFLVFLITSSVMYMVTGNGINSMALAIPVLLLAAYPLGLIQLAFVFVLVIVLVAIFAYFLFLR